MKKRVMDIASALLVLLSIGLLVYHFAIPKKGVVGVQPPVEAEHALTESECAPSDVDLGEVTLGTTVTQSYVLRNTGRNPLVAIAVNPDCHCTDFKVSKWIAPPRDSIVVTLVVDTSDKKPGRSELRTVVKTNTGKEFHLLKLSFDII